jgi:hypothetical protein
MAKKKILFIIGSLNQTTQMHQVANMLPDYDCFFSQLYSNNPLIKLAVKLGLLNSTVLAGTFKDAADTYLANNNLPNDYATKKFKNDYSLVVLCSDMLIPKQLSKHKTIWIQEGMTDPITPWSKLVHTLHLPYLLTLNTAFNGCSNISDIYCAASAGYKKQFASLGTTAEKIFVTGIPNYDNIVSFLQNDFPYHDYVMVATSDTRETGKIDNREKFISHCVDIANGRKLIFKLHPNEKKERAIAEIKRLTPSDTLIFTEGNINHMIANCSELITQFSTVVYTGIALGKKVHSNFVIAKLKYLSPIQNNGNSAFNIASICRNYIEYKGDLKDFLQLQHRTKHHSQKLQNN